MKTLNIDFTTIVHEEEFYQKLAEQIQFPEGFGNNLDALYDVITGYWELPLTIKFIHLSIEQLELFEDIITTFEDADNDCEEFYFSYFIEQYEE